MLQVLQIPVVHSFLLSSISLYEFTLSCLSIDVLLGIGLIFGYHDKNISSGENFKKKIRKSLPLLQFLKNNLIKYSLCILPPLLEADTFRDAFIKAVTISSIQSKPASVVPGTCSLNARTQSKKEAAPLAPAETCGVHLGQRFAQEASDDISSKRPNSSHPRVLAAPRRRK